MRRIAGVLCCAMTIQFMGYVPLASAETMVHNSVMQERKVTGTVRDGMGNPLIGVSVKVKNTANGVITDLDGKFSVSVSKGDVLVFSYVGMTTREVSTDGVTTLNIVLEEDAAALDEVVVIGYGTVKRAICRVRCLLFPVKKFRNFLLLT